MAAEHPMHRSLQLSHTVTSVGGDGPSFLESRPPSSVGSDPESPRPPPIYRKWNLLPCLLFAFFLCATGFYLYIRVITLGGYYTIFVFAVECLGLTSFIPYAILLLRGVFPSGSPGLPEEDTLQVDVIDMEQRFSIRVLVPCYKEPLDVVAGTVLAAMAAKLPPGASRTVYLLDDGTSPEKQAFIQSFNSPEVQYITGRERTPGQVNGKSENLNHALRKIYGRAPRNGSTRRGRRGGNKEPVIEWGDISIRELVVVFDADMRAKQDFFLKTLEVMSDEDLALCLTPQAFHNVDADADLFNNNNKQFWEYWLPGAFAWGYIACTGTNFVIRARALAHCGLFPNNCITEDYALGMELKRKGYRATYLMQYVAEGEAPLEIRNVLQQRSRWTKGHFQVFLSSENALISPDLPFFQRFWYSYAAWAPICTIITVPVFMVVPFMSIVFGLHPVNISFYFVLSSTCYVVSILSIQYYVRVWADMKVMWFVNISNTVLWFTFTKALLNTVLARLGFKAMVFKVTKKAEVAGDGQVLPTPMLPRGLSLGDRLKRTASHVSQRVASTFMLARERNTPDRVAFLSTSIGDSSEAHAGGIDERTMKDSSRFDPRTIPGMATAASAPHAYKKIDFTVLHTALGHGDDLDQRDNQVHLPPFKRPVEYSDPNSASSTPRAIHGHQQLKRRHNTTHKYDGSVLRAKPASQPPSRHNSDHKTPLNLSPPPPSEPRSGPKGSRLMRVVRSFTPKNVQDFGEMLDPVALLLMFIFCVVTAALGIWQLTVNAPDTVNSSFAFNSPLHGSPYLVIASLWALHNAVAPYLFLHYCASDGTSFKFMTKVLSFLSTLLMVAAIIFIWMLIPEEYSIQEVFSLALNNLYPNSIARDNNTNYAFVSGLNMTSVQVPGTVNLSGGLLVSDHVKYGMPVAYSIASLAWAYIQFPSGYKVAGEERVLLETLREGASYLMRCNLNPGDHANPLWAAQVGNGADYLVLDHKGFDPEAYGSVWTSPSEDPQLMGSVPRLVWVMSKDASGADVLAGYAAALSAVGIAFKDIDPVFSSEAIGHAVDAYQLATVNDADPQSYCRYVPCTINVTVKTEVVARPAELVVKNETNAICWYVDWLDMSCKVGSSVEKCVWKLNEIVDVYTTRLACCNLLFNAKVWDKLETKAQGVCAVPDDEWTCFIPDKSQRTCFSEAIDPSTGQGCVGKGIEVFASPVACCNYLSRNGIIDASLGLTGSGMCAEESLDNSFTSCYVPSLADRQCLVRTGKDCTYFGTENSFEDSVACCNRLIAMMDNQSPVGKSAEDKTPLPIGICMFTNESLVNVSRYSRKFETTPASGSEAKGSASTGRRRSILGGNFTVDENTLWKVPVFNSTELCDRDSHCAVHQMEEVKEVAMYNSTSVFDDLAWGGIWLYKATGNAKYLGQAQRFLQRHYTEDINAETLSRDRSYYVPDWNNLAWASNALLAQITLADAYKSRLHTLLSAWVFGDVLPSDHPIPTVGKGLDPADPILENFTDPATNVTYEIVPDCVPTSSYEKNCFDNIDDDCDGNVDKEDVACGLFPVLYSPKQLAFTLTPSLPHAANAAFLAMIYSDIVPKYSQSRLRCWALGQVNYMVGAVQGVQSYVVGFHGDSPTIVQQRASSCPSPSDSLPAFAFDNEPQCSFSSAYWPGTPNPQIDLVKGGLVWGPGKDDSYDDVRQSDSTRLTVDGSVGLTAVLAGILDTNTGHKSCQLLHGVFQRYVQGEDSI